jgi:hypothetical protein
VVVNVCGAVGAVVAVHCLAFGIVSNWVVL